MVSELVEYTLSDLVSRVIDNRGKNPPYQTFGHEVIETGCISGSSRFPDYSLVKKHVDENTYENWFRSGHPQRGDILIITVGNGIGSISIMKNTRGVITQNLIGLSFKSLVDSNFIYYYLNQNHIYEYFQNLNIGSAQPSLKVPHLLGLLLRVPPIQEQKEIAHILGSLDDKIELNLRMNKTLEGMAQALFKSWFVDFDPVIDNALKAGNSIPEELTKPAEIRRKALADGTANREVAKQFPDKFQLTEEMGWIPEGWEASKLDRLFIPKKGKNITKKTIIDGIIPVIAGGLQPAYYHNSYNVKGPAITISASGANAGYVKLYYQNIWASDCSYVSKIEVDFLYSAFLFLKNRQDEITSMQQGAVQPHVYPKDLLRLSLANPPKHIWQKMEVTIESLFDKISLNQKEIINLSKLRDTLLPKLISGELRVPDAEKLVEEVL